MYSILLYIGLCDFFYLPHLIQMKGNSDSMRHSIYEKGLKVVVRQYLTQEKISEFIRQMIWNFFSAKTSI